MGMDHAHLACPRSLSTAPIRVARNVGGGGGASPQRPMLPAVLNPVPVTSPASSRRAAELQDKKEDGRSYLEEGVPDNVEDGDVERRLEEARVWGSLSEKEYDICMEELQCAIDIAEQTKKAAGIPAATVEFYQEQYCSSGGESTVPVVQTDALRRFRAAVAEAKEKEVFGRSVYGPSRGEDKLLPRTRAALMALEVAHLAHKGDKVRSREAARMLALEASEEQGAWVRQLRVCNDRVYESVCPFLSYEGPATTEDARGASGVVPLEGRPPLPSSCVPSQQQWSGACSTAGSAAPSGSVASQRKRHLTNPRRCSFHVRAVLVHGKRRLRRNDEDEDASGDGGLFGKSGAVVHEVAHLFGDDEDEDEDEDEDFAERPRVPKAKKSKNVEPGLPFVFEVAEMKHTCRPSTLDNEAKFGRNLIREDGERVAKKDVRLVRLTHRSNHQQRPSLV